MRKMALALACASILGTSTAQAIGLGEMAVRSYLNQPLRAEIPLTDVSAGELDQIRAGFASARSFEEQGLSLSAVAGRIQVQLQGGKHPRIVLTSNAPVRDPVLGVVLELEGPGGVLRRAYDILLDPVTYRPPQPVVSAVTGRKAAPVSRSEPGAAASAPTSRAPAVPLAGRVENGRYIVRSGDTLWRIAFNLRPDGVSTERMMAALRAANPNAFADPSRDETLLTGASLRIPALEEARTAKVVKPQAPAVSEKDAEPAAPAPSAPAVIAPEAPAEPRVAIVAPAQPVAPVVGEVVTPPVVAPVVGEIVSPAATAGETPVPGSAGTDLIQMQEQLEALKIEKEQLHERLGTSEGQMEKMEELLRLKDEQIAQLEQLVAQIGDVEKRLESAVSTEPSVPAEVEKPAQAQVSRPPAPVTPPAQPGEQGGLMATLTNPVSLGAGGLVALLVALLIGRQRRRREQEAALQPVAVPETLSKDEAPSPAVEAVPMAVAGATSAAAVGGAMLGGLEGQEPSQGVSDPVQSVLDEVDVMQAYGLHDRAREVLDEAIARMPEADVLSARRIRLFHEMGAQEDFLRAAEEYHATHPLADDPHWAGIQAIGMASYPDAPLFGGSGTVAHAAAADVEVPSSVFEAPALDLAPASEPAAEPLASLALQESGTDAQPEGRTEQEEALLGLTVAESPVAEQLPGEQVSLEPLSLELPDLGLATDEVEQASRTETSESLAELDLAALELETFSAPFEEKPVAEPLQMLPEVESAQATQAPEFEPLAELDLHDLSLEPASSVGGAELPALEPVVEATSSVQAEAGTISEDDLMLLGLDASSIEAEPLDLSSLPVVEEEVLPEPVEPSRPVMETALPTAPLLSPQGEEQGVSGEAYQAMTSASLDERELKLDMAQALVDLGDHDAARSMLEEVASEREDELTRRARDMLERTTA